MFKRNKKQPYRNTIKRVKKKEAALSKERASLLALKKEAQLYLANAQRERAIALDLTEKAHQREEKARQYEQFTKEELSRANKIHPSLGYQQYINENDHAGVNFKYPPQDFVLNYRFTRPQINWNDDSQNGTIKMLIGNAKSGKNSYVGYAVSKRTITDMRPEMLQEITTTMGRQIAEDLLSYAIEQLRK